MVETSTLIVIIIFISLAIFAYIELSNTPLGKALNSLFGTIGGILNGIDGQIDTCNDVGWFDVSKGCYAGVLGIGVGILYAAFKFIRLFYKGGGSLNNELEKQQALEPGSTRESVEKEIMPKILEVAKDAEAKGLSPDQQKAAIEKAGGREIGNKIIDTAAQNGENVKPQQHESYTEFDQSVNKNNELDPSEAAKVDDVVDEYVAEP